MASERLNRSYKSSWPQLVAGLVLAVATTACARISLIYNRNSSVRLTALNGAPSAVTPGDVFVVAGKNFLPTDKITVQGVECTPTTFISSTEMSCTLPNGVGATVGTVAVVRGGTPIASMPSALRTAIVLGQSTATNVPEISETQNVPYGIRICGGKLFVLETGHRRVMVWNSPDDALTKAPDFVIGQPDKSTTATDVTNQRQFRTAYGFTCTDDYLVVVDEARNRVLIWNSLPASDYQPADVVLGQPDFTSSVANNGGISARSLNRPTGTFIDSDGRLYITDQSNCRVLVWSSIPSTNFADANFVVGQADFLSSGAAVAANRFSFPMDVIQVGNSMAISDLANRILIFDKVTASNPNAIRVLGQLNMTDSSSALAANRLNRPFHLASDGTRLAVCDENNRRALIWNSLPATDGANADVAIGQADFTSAVSAPSPLTDKNIVACHGLYLHKQGSVEKLYVGDTNSKRILIFNGPYSTFQSASAVIGKADFTDAAAPALVPSAAKLGTGISGVARSGNRIAVADSNRNRVLIWTSLPTQNKQSADIVLGQVDGTVIPINAGNGSASAIGLRNPVGVAISGNKLIVSDQSNHRVLIWDPFPTSNLQPADVVLGQTTFTGASANQGGTANAGTMNSPSGVAVIDGRLYVADSGNNRVLVFNSIPSTYPTAANAVIGQSTVTTTAANSPTRSAATLSSPYAIAGDASAIYISDRGNNRVLRYSSLPLITGQAADLVLGQSGFADATNAGTADASGNLDTPLGIHFYDGFLGVANLANHSLRFWASPLATGAFASKIFGQNLYTDIAANRLTAPSLESVSSPIGIHLDGELLIVADRGNNRVIIHPRSP